MKTTGKTTGIILAGGSGKRLKSKVPKQFLKLKNKPVILYSLLAFEKNSLVDRIVVVSHKNYLAYMKELIRKYGFRKVHCVVPGGKTRQGSSFIGLKNCPPDTELVLIHDAARPFITARLIEKTLNAAKKTGAATASAPITDTVFVEDNGFVKCAADRTVLRKVHTPQAFKYGLIKKAHEAALRKGIRDATDDCALVMLAGKRVKLTKSPDTNIKITTKTDLHIAKTLF